MQRVKVGERYSVYKSIISGVPQGSVLGPLLFVVFINDIVDVGPINSTTKLFADDLKTYVAGNDRRCKESFVSTISDLLHWAKIWQLPIAFKKSSWGIITRGKANGIELSVDDNCLVRIEGVKDLGVKFDYKLNFAAHIDDIVSSSKRRLFLLHKCILSRDPDVLIKGFKTYVLPLLDYNSQIWSPYKQGDIMRVESVQRGFLKKLKGYEDIDYCARLVKAKLCTLELRRLRADLVLCFKIVHNLVPLKTEAFFKFDTRCITRGNKYKIMLVQAKAMARYNFFASRVVNVWNSLQDDAVCLPCINSFKNHIIKINFSTFLLQSFDTVSVPC
jgi:ribonuclease P/MRP protein subunit RPP40